MDRLLNPPLLTLRKGELLPLPAAAGRAVAVFSGHLWLTEAGDGRDIVLGAGDSHRITRDGLTVVEALADASLIVLDGADATPRPSVERVQREAHAARNELIADVARRIARRIADAPRLLWARR